MHNQEYILENEMLKLLWYFETQIDNLISTRRPYQATVKKTKR